MKRQFATVSALCLMLGACDLAPDYHVPVVAVPAQFKESVPWQPAQPSDARPRGAWWSDYHDPVLDSLEGQVDQANPTLAASAAAYDQARAFADQAEAGLYPSLGFGGGLTRNRQSDERPLRSKGQPNYYGNNGIGMVAGYELDFWGRVHNLAAAGSAAAESANAAMEVVRLGLHAELAADYVDLRGYDALSKLLGETVAAYAKALQLTQTLFDGQIASAIDVERARNQLSVAKAQVADVTARRALLEHAIASLVGKPASTFAIGVSADEIALPPAPASVPSALLERRPDIAAAERQVAATNSLIGVAKAAFYPQVTIGGTGGTLSTGYGLLSMTNSVWSLGPSVSIPIFEGGLLDARLAAAKAAFDQSGQIYRETVLHAFQEVEDNLALLHWLEQEETEETLARDAARHALDLSLSRYREGISSYLEVVTAQTALLEADRAVLTLRTRRLGASIGLIKSLGGGWGGVSSPKSPG